MMNTSSNRHARRLFPVSALLYRDVTSQDDFLPHSLLADPLLPDVQAQEKHHAHSDPKPSPGISAQELDARIAAARTEAIAETEARLAQHYEARATQRLAKIRETIERFRDQRKEYFDKVESDVVHLALAIAQKILHREAQVDPMLIAGVVRVAIDKLHDGSSVTVRVAPAEAETWRTFLANPANGSTIQVVEDENLAFGDCLLETDLGSASFSLDSQLKEIELGFFDLLAQRPAIR